DSLSLLVKPDVAAKQLETEATTRAGQASYPTGAEKEPATVSGVGEATSMVYGKTTPTAPLPPKRYHGSVQLAPTRLARDVGQIAEEVIQHLTSLVGAQVEVTLEINAVIPNGVPENVVRIVTENGRTLKFKTQGFEIE
ncbi:MAG: AAA+ family ATPase, partial [bacterium]